jgi:hypothetical protein
MIPILGIFRIIMRLREKSIKGVIGVKDGFRDGFRSDI